MGMGSYQLTNYTQGLAPTVFVFEPVGWLQNLSDLTGNMAFWV